MKPHKTRLRSIVNSSGLILRIGLLMMVVIGCKKNEVKCEGCDKDTPWSKNESSYCYPTKEDCEAVEGEGCEKCR
jgi:hypothetical protein